MLNKSKHKWYEMVIYDGSGCIEPWYIQPNQRYNEIHAYGMQSVLFVL